MRYEKTKLSVAFLAAIMVFVCSVPMVSYASIMAVQKIETKIIDDYANKHDVIETMEPIYELEEVLEVADANSLIEVKKKSILSLERGGNFLSNFIVPADAMIAYMEIELKKGDTVQIIVSSKGKDSYIGGIIDSSNQKRYVKAGSNGGITHTFTITKADTYMVFFEGQNGNEGSDIILNGSIVVN